MFIVSLNYTKALDAVDALLDSHRAYLKTYFDCGVFVLAGPKQPRNGGVIIAQAPTRAELQAILEQDPFFIGGVADYAVIEVKPTMVAGGLESLLTD